MQKIKLLKTITLAMCFLFLFFLIGQAFAAVECGDNIDNDGDGKKDYSATAGAGDAQCASATDGHESDNPLDWQDEPLFSTHNTWYEKIPDNPSVMVGSASFVAVLADGSRSPWGELDFAAASSWGTPIYYVNKNQAVVNVTLDPAVTTQAANYARAHGYNYVPIPTHAVPAGNIEYCAGTYRDAHMIIISKEKRCSDVSGNYNTQATCEEAGGHWGRWEWDFFRIKNCSILTSYDSSQWITRAMTKYDLDGDGMNQPRDGNIAGTRAVLGAQMHGKVTWEEMNDAINNGIPVPHAIAFSFPGVSADTTTLYPMIYPSYTGWSTAYNKFGFYTPRLSMRIQLDPSYNCDANITKPEENVICHAFQTYGVIYVDNSGSSAVSLEDLYHNPYQDGRNWASVGVSAAYDHSESFTQFRLNAVKNYLRVVNPIMPKRQCVNNVSTLDGKPCMSFNEGECADGIDNDNPSDGKIDYPADPGCGSAYGDNNESDTSSQYLLADVNQDNSVNIQDIQIVVKVITGALTNSRADVNGDGVKNIKDIQEIVRAIIGG